MMSAEQIEAQIVEWEEKYDLNPDIEYETEDVQNLFDLQAAYTAIGDIASAAQVFDSLRPIIETFRESDKDTDKGLEFLADWNFIAMRHTDEVPTEFICMPYYRELLDAFTEAPEKFRLKEVKSKLQLVHHFRYWIATGGNYEVIAEDEREFLRHMHDGYVQEVETLLDDLRAKGEWKNLVDTEKSLYKFFNHSRKPNETVKWLKATIEDMPQLEETKDVDIAELHVELGQLFFQYKKYPAANKYFKLAFDTYSLHIDEEDEHNYYDVLAAQAEGWMDECEKMMR